MELRKLVEEFLALNERQRQGIATERELTRWRELREKLARWPQAQQRGAGKTKA